VSLLFLVENLPRFIQMYSILSCFLEQIDTQLLDLARILQLLFFNDILNFFDTCSCA
jgi:hypothetical protein